MSKLIFTLNRDWIDEKRKNFGNPIRALEKKTRDIEGVTLLKSETASIHLEMEEDIRQSVVDEIVYAIQTLFEEPSPWDYLKVDGETDGINLGGIPKGRKAESKEEPSEPQEQQAEPARPKKEVDQIQSASTGAPTEKRPEEALRTPDGKKEATTPIADEHQNDTIEKICQDVPMRYSPELAGYLHEIGNVIPMLRDMRTQETLWAQNLLVSIDNGFGYSNFLSSISKIYRDLGVCKMEENEDGIVEMEVVAEDVEPDHYHTETWGKIVEKARDCARTNRNRCRYTVFSIDMSNVTASQLRTSLVRNYIRQICEFGTSFTVVFRVPFLEPQNISDIRLTLEEVMAVRTLVVPPISIDDMVDFIRRDLQKHNCTLAKDAEEIVEQLITLERNTDSFFGYKSLDKLVQKMIYERAKMNCIDGLSDSTIKREVLENLIDDPDFEKDPQEMLAALIGMEAVKEQLKQIIIQIQTQKELADKGKNVQRPCIHMMFTGNPGTGKTTVARIVGRLLREEGVLKKGFFHEIKGRDLCGRYVGETTPKTSRYCRDAYGSILFVDEAYSLYTRDSYGGDYGREALTALVAEMENHRDDFCVIFAGYKEDMMEMLDGNAGLRSRVPFIIDFPNYTRDELEEMFFKMMSGNFEFEDGLRDAVHDFFQNLSDEYMNSKEFSNGRLVRNLYERTWGKAAYRRRLSGEDEMVVTASDLATAYTDEELEEMQERHGNIGPIGFV